MSETPAPERQEVLDALSQALEAAQVAVEADPDAQLGATAISPTVAQRYYTQALAALDPVLDRLPEPHRSAMVAKADGYRARVRALELSSARLSRSARTSTGSSRSSGSVVGRPRRMSMSRIQFQPMDLPPPQLEQRPSSALRRPYWTMRIVGGTLRGSGGYLTPRVYVPPMVYQQDGCKIPGMSAKTTALESVAQLLVHMGSVALPCDRDSIAHATTEWTALWASLAAIQNNLSRPFPFINEVAEPGVEAAPAGGGHKSNFAQLGSIMAQVGRSVKKGATTAYERLGAAVPGRVTEEELMRYTHLMTRVFETAQFMDTWIQVMENTVVPPGMEGATEAQIASLRDKIGKSKGLTDSVIRVTDFFRTVVVELVMRDVEVLLERYLRKTRKAFARMYWDEEGQP